MAAYLDKTLSFLGLIFLGAEKESWSFVRVGRGLEGYRRGGSRSSSWAALAAAVTETASSAARHNPSTAAASRACPLECVQEPPVPGESDERDERALQLFGYRLGLMCRFEGMWWCDKRVRRDYKAICMWLKLLHLTEQPGIEGEMWREMMEVFELAESIRGHHNTPPHVTQHSGMPIGTARHRGS